jgi:hypothetical protein
LSVIARFDVALKSRWAYLRFRLSGEGSGRYPVFPIVPGGKTLAKAKAAPKRATKKPAAMKKPAAAAKAKAPARKKSK